MTLYRGKEKWLERLPSHELTGDEGLPGEPFGVGLGRGVPKGWSFLTDPKIEHNKNQTLKEKPGG